MEGEGRSKKPSTPPPMDAMRLSCYRLDRRAKLEYYIDKMKVLEKKGAFYGFCMRALDKSHNVKGKNGSL
jgi:hypothetical protein